MKPLTASRVLVTARTGLIIAALALVGYAADNLANEQRVAGPAKTVSTTNAASTGEQYCPTEVSPHSLFLEDANGNAFKLVHTPGYGWKYIARQSSDGADRGAAVRNVTFSPVAAAQAETIETPVDDPMAVFIDGPTGYTFTWTRDSGWRYVGHISDQKHAE